MLERAEIDSKSHPTMEALASSTASAGITTKEIISEVDWSTVSIFHKFYYDLVLYDTCGLRWKEMSYKVTIDM